MSVPFYNLLFNLRLDSGSSVPLYLQLTAAVVEVIQSGKLQPGAPMPGTRTLAKALGIGRNAAIGAYGELHGQGWIETEIGFGTRVAHLLPEPAGRVRPAHACPHPCGFDLSPAWHPPAPMPEARVDLRDGGPDPRLFAAEELARAFRQPISRHFGHRTRPGDPRGPQDAREALAGFLRERRSLGATADDLLLVGGAQEALGLIARNLLPPGSCVAVEDPGNPKAWATFQQAGLDLVPVPVDAQGLVPEALEDVCLERRPRALYLTPCGQCPTGAVLSAERRMAVLELAGRYRMPILEDDLSAEWFFDERDWRPLAADDTRGVVLLVGGFDRLLGPGFSLAFIHAPTEAVAWLMRARAEEGGPEVTLLAGVLRDLLLDGSLVRFVRKARNAYRERREAACEGLAFLGADRAPLSPSPSGLGLWLRPEGRDLDQLQRTAENLGILLRPAHHWCLGEEAEPGLFFPFGPLEARELGEVLGLLRRAWTRGLPAMESLAAPGLGQGPLC